MKQFQAKGGRRERVAVPGEPCREGGLFGGGAEHQRKRVQRGNRRFGHQLAVGNAHQEQKRPNNRLDIILYAELVRRVMKQFFCAPLNYFS